MQSTVLSVALFGVFCLLAASAAANPVPLPDASTTAASTAADPEPKVTSGDWNKVDITSEVIKKLKEFVVTICVNAGNDPAALGDVVDAFERTADKGGYEYKLIFKRSDGNPCEVIVHVPGDPKPRKITYSTCKDVPVHAS